MATQSTVQVKMDTTQLDEILKKIELLIERSEKVLLGLNAFNTDGDMRKGA